MSWTAHKTEDELQEHFSDETTIKKQASEIAKLMRESPHTIFFTGAGISTSAGIPDFRGPQGVWTMRAQGKEATARTSTIRATPTITHMAILALIKHKLAHFVVSQNTDGIHRSEHSKSAKLCVALGSSLTVSPANEVPIRVARQEGGKLVICNLQKTPMDNLANVRVFCPNDVLMEQVMKELDIPIEPWILKRHAKFGINQLPNNKCVIKIWGVDTDGVPATIFQDIEVSNDSKGWGKSMNTNTDMSEFFSDQLHWSELGQLSFKLQFMGHYGEPKLTLSLCNTLTEKQDSTATVQLQFHSNHCKWLTPKWIGQDV